MRVLATAGHVDHGKSALVRALTGAEPDRWAEEHRRGLTIDLGYAWTTLPTGQVVSFVDVPGHQRFLGNMLAGIGPAPAVVLVVAADEGWRAQTTEHLDAVRALDIRHGVVAVTRCDLAGGAGGERTRATIAQVRERLAATGLAGAEIVACSSRTGEGLDELRAALTHLCDALPEPCADGRVRLWIDRVFTIRGAGTVVTGTLERGTLRVGDALGAVRPDEGDERRVSVRGLQALEEDRDEVAAVARVAVNLRGVATEDLARGDLLLTPGAWATTRHADVRLEPLHEEAGALPEYLMAHVGTRGAQVRVRPLGRGSARLAWSAALPLAAGDRLVLRDPGRQVVLAGAQVLDADPPALRRRGAARARGDQLESADARFDLVAEVGRRGFLSLAGARAQGVGDADVQAARRSGGVREAAGVLVSPATWEAWRADLLRAVSDAVERDPLQARLAVKAAADAAGLPPQVPTAALVAALVADPARPGPGPGSDADGVRSLALADGYLTIPGRGPSLGAAEAGVAQIERRLREKPFAASEREDLARLGLTSRHLALAVRLGRLIDLGDQILLAPNAPARAMRELAALPQPFTTSQARQALGTTRRVVIPLLEHLDRRGWTRRIDAGHREVVR